MNRSLLFLLEKVETRQRAQDRPLRVLDFGCGRGELVALARSRGHDWVGVDSFYGQDARAEDVAPGALVGRIPLGGNLPFPGGAFDVVLSNHVFEHVGDPDHVLGELERVLAPGGIQWHIIPCQERWREGHTRVFLAHRVPDGSLRREWCHLWHALHLTTFHQERWPVWWERIGGLLRDNTWLRPVAFYEAELGRRFRTRRLDAEKLGWMLRRRRLGWLPLPAWLVQWIEPRRGSITVECSPRRAAMPDSAPAWLPPRDRASIPVLAH